MRSTTERLRPGDITLNPIFCQNLTVYAYAQKFIKDKIVLDLGCGEGYGAMLLAKSAKKVIAVDYSLLAIQHAKENQHADNLEFLQMDLARLKVNPLSFEVITAVQVIEHLKKPEPFLFTVRSALKEAGVFLLSTPHKKNSLVEHPYHFREYNPEDLRELLGKYFAQVEILGLRFNEKVAAFRVKRRTESERFLRHDPLKLHLVLPRFIRQRLFDYVAARLSKKIHLDNPALTEGITPLDYWISEEGIDSTIDLIAFCQK